MPTSIPCYDLIFLWLLLFIHGGRSVKSKSKMRTTPQNWSYQKFDYHFLGSDEPRSRRDETYLIGYFDTNIKWADLQTYGIIEYWVFISYISLI